MSDYDAAASTALADYCRQNLEDEVERLQSLLPRVNYIATYRAECVDGSTVTANLAMESVVEGTAPAALIEVITEQAFADMAHSGRNATHVVVLNLSRVW